MVSVESSSLVICKGNISYSTVDMMGATGWCLVTVTMLRAPCIVLGKLWCCIEEAILILMQCSMHGISRRFGLDHLPSFVAYALIKGCLLYTSDAADE